MDDRENRHSRVALSPIMSYPVSPDRSVVCKPRYRLSRSQEPKPRPYRIQQVALVLRTPSLHVGMPSEPTAFPVWDLVIQLGAGAAAGLRQWARDELIDFHGEYTDGTRRQENVPKFMVVCLELVPSACGMFGFGVKGVGGGMVQIELAIVIVTRRTMCYVLGCGCPRRTVHNGKRASLWREMKVFKSIRFFFPRIWPWPCFGGMGSCWRTCRAEWDDAQFGFLTGVACGWLCQKQVWAGSKTHRHSILPCISIFCSWWWSPSPTQELPFSVHARDISSDTETNPCFLLFWGFSWHPVLPPSETLPYCTGSPSTWSQTGLQNKVTRCKTRERNTLLLEIFLWRVAAAMVNILG